MMEILSATPVFQGIAIAPAHIITHSILDVPKYFVVSNRVADEQQRFHDVLKTVHADIELIRQQESSYITEEILEVYLLIINDIDFHTQVTNTIKQSFKNAEWAVQIVMKSYVQKLKGSADSSLRERTKDLYDIMERIISCLKNEQITDVNPIRKPCILVAHSLFSSQFLQYPRENITGIVLEHGGKTSHTAIIARAFGIPMVVDAFDALDYIAQDQLIVLNARKGKIILSPCEQDLQKYREISEVEKKQMRFLEDKASHLKHSTLDDNQLSFQVNIDVVEELESPACKFADGIGLFRTEFFLTDVPIHHSTSQQYEVYAKLLSFMNDKPVVVRTMDMGGDKLPYSFQEVEEDNPLLGYRGIRFALGNKQLFYNQLRTLIKASTHGTLHLLIPMISTVEELLETKELYTSAYKHVKEELSEEIKPIKFGVMLEVPSLLYTLDDIAPHCDFWSIGTNDLLQYTMAADRNNYSTSYLYSYFQPAFLRILQHIFYKSHELKIPVTMCGEMASDLNSIALLIGGGLRSFSISPAQLPAVISYATSLRVSDTRNLFEQAVLASSVEKIQSYVEAFNKECTTA